MPDRLSLEQIRDFWTEQARQHGQAHSASWSDRSVMDMEVREILKHLEDGDRVIDVGCANGYSTVQFASQRNVRIRGVDYVSEMIDQARLRLTALALPLEGAVEFAHGDVTALQEPSGAYDKVVIIRVLINLGDWDRQLTGIRECARVLRRGGTLLMSEATVQGWRRLNRFRQEWGLPDISMPPFNQYLDEDQLKADLPSELKLVEVVNFASSYYVGTRVLKPLLARALGGNIDTADPDMEWNRWCATLPPCGDYGTQKLFICRKQ